MAGTVITKKGLQLIAKLVASETALTFTRAAVGIGSVPSGYDPGSMTDLNSYKMDGAIYSCSASDDEASIVMQISSIGVETGFTITEAGLFATDPDDGEILYSYLDLSKDPQYIYAENSAISKFVEMTLVVKIGTVDKVTAYINPGSFVTREGDISETTIETLEDSSEKYPIPTAGEKVKVFFGKILTFLKNIKPLEANMTVYVSPSGSDTTGDGTQSKPFLTLAHTLNSLPKNLGGNSCTITLADGTYEEFTIVAGFTNGTLTITSNNTEALSAACAITGLYVDNNVAQIRLVGLNFIRTNGIPITITKCLSVYMKYCQANGSATSSNGIYIVNSANTLIDGCKVTNHNSALYAYNSKVSSLNWDSGTSNIYGIITGDGAIVNKIGNQPTGTTKDESQNSGSVFFRQNGTQISEMISSGLACTWGTMTGGYHRVGNLIGTAEIVVKFRIVITSALTAGTQYSITGLPMPSTANLNAVPICSNKPSITKECYVSGSTLLFTPTTNISVGDIFYFSGTYITTT